MLIETFFKFLTRITLAILLINYESYHLNDKRLKIFLGMQFEALKSSPELQLLVQKYASFFISLDFKSLKKVRF